MMMTFEEQEYLETPPCCVFCGKKMRPSGKHPEEYIDKFLEKHGGNLLYVSKESHKIGGGSVCCSCDRDFEKYLYDKVQVIIKKLRHIGSL
jgi:hypothetical protein